MKKTTKYYLESEAVEVTTIQKLEITKKQYDQMVKDLAKELIETKDYECPLEKEDYNYDYPTFTKTMNKYRVGCYTLYLTVIKCKPGYVFK